MSLPIRGRALLLLSAALLLVAVSLAACGGGGSSSSSETTAAEETAAPEESTGGEETGEEAEAGGASEIAAAAKAVAEEHKEVTEIGPTEPVGKPIPKGKKLIYVNCGQPACIAQGEAFTAAGEALGWKVETISIKLPTPEEIQAAFDEVIRRKPDGVASAGLGPALYPRQVKELNAMNIPIMEEEGEVESGENGITYDPLGPKKTAEAMGVLANKSVADAGGEGEFGAVLLTGFPIVSAYTAGWVEEIEAICSECKVKTLEVSPESIGKDASAKIATFLRANPGIKSLYLSYDALGTGLNAAIKNAGAEVPKSYAWGVDAPGIQELQTGELTAAIPDPYNEISWQLVDGFARIFVGEEPVETFQEPIIWSSEFENVPEETEPFPAIVPDYQKQFEKLWGVG